MSQNYNKGNEGHYYTVGQPPNVPPNMQNMNPRNQQQQQPQQQPGVYQTQIPVSAAHELKQLPAGMTANYAMYRPQLAQQFPNATMMVNPMQNHQRQNFITAAGNMQVTPQYVFNPVAFPPGAYGLTPRAPAPFRATGHPQQVHYAYQQIPQNIYYQQPQIHQPRHTIPQQIQAAQIPAASNGIANIQPEPIPMTPIMTSQPPPPPAQTPTQPIPVAVPVQVPAAPPTVAPEREKKILQIVNPDTKEIVDIESLKKTKKPRRTSDISTIPAPAPDFMMAGGQIGLPPQLAPLIFDSTNPGTRKHWGNDPIWTPPQQLQQQQTPEVSANVDGPSVEPKQIPKKIPKPVQSTATVVSKPPTVPQEDSPTHVEHTDSGVDVKSDSQYSENEVQVGQNTSDEPVVECIEEITQEMEQLSIVTESIEYMNTEMSQNEEGVEDINETEEVITDINETQTTLATIIQEKSVGDNDTNKELSKNVQQQQSKSMPLDETDRVLQTIRSRPEHVLSDFERVMEKYGGQFADKAFLPPGLPIKDPANTENNGTTTTTTITPTTTSVDLSKQEDPAESDNDDDADKENNIQNKKYSSQEAPTIKPPIEYHKEQWSPSNPSGKKFYTVEQLLQLGKQVSSMDKSSLKINPSIQNALISSQQFRVEAFLQKHRTNNQSKFNLNRPSQGNRGMHPMNQKMMMPNQKQQSDTIKISLSLHEDVKLKEIPNAWKPKHLSNDCNLGEEERILRNLTDNFRCVLNKLTPENFTVLLKEVKQYQITKYEHLHACIQLIFEKAISEPNFSVTYAEMCKQLSTICVSGGDGNSKQQFKNCLINQCQSEFENAHKIKSSKDRSDLLDKELDPVKKEELRESLEEEDYRMRKRAVGTVRFIGELYKIDLLTIKIMHTCVKLLMDPRTMDEESLECLCKLLTTVGKKMESDARDCLSIYFQQLQDIIGKKAELKISSRIKFMIQDLIDLRNTRWVSRRNDQNPKTMGQIQKELETEQRNIQLLNYNQGPPGHNQQGGRNRYDRRGGPQMNYKPEKLSFDSKKINFSGLSGNNMESETKLGHAGFFQQWNAQGSNKFQPDDDREDRERAHYHQQQQPQHQQMPPPGFHHHPQHHHNQQMQGSGPPSLPSMGMMHPFGNNSNKRGGDKDMYRSRGSNEYRRDYRDNNHHDNRYHRGGNDSLSRSSSFNRNLGPPPGMMQQQHPSAPQMQQQQQQHQSSSASSSRLSSSSGRGSVDSHSNLYTGNSSSSDRRSIEKIIECAEPSADERASLKKEFEGIFHDFFNSPDEHEYAVIDMQRIQRKYRWAAVYEAAAMLLDHKVTERAALAKLCIVYIKSGNETFTVSELLKVFGSLCEMVIGQDLHTDVPKVWSYIAEYLGPLMKEGILRLNDLLIIGESCVRSEKGHELLLAVMKHIDESYQFDVTRDLWCQSGLSWQQFMPQYDNEELVQVIQGNPLLSALDQASSGVSGNQQQRHNWDLTEQSILQFCNRERPDEARLRVYIDDWVTKCNTHMDDPNFIRAFTAAIVHYCIDKKTEKTDAKVNYTLNDKRFLPIRKLLKSYVYNKTSREIESLTAIQCVVQTLEYPKSLLHNIFSQLYEENVISRNGFLTWYRDSSRYNGVAKLALRQWFISISEENSEHSSGEENN